MSETSSPRRVLHLVVAGASAAKAEEIAGLSKDVTSEIFTLTEANAGEALEKIFAADTIAVWTDL